MSRELKHNTKGKAEFNSLMEEIASESLSKSETSTLGKEVYSSLNKFENKNFGPKK